MWFDGDRVDHALLQFGEKISEKIKAAEGVDPQPVVDNQDFTQAIGE
jgi:hypothetical protein